MLGPPPGRWRWTVWGSIWLVFLAGAFQQALPPPRRGAGRRHSGPARVLRRLRARPALILRLPQQDPRRWGFPLLLFGLATALLPITGQDGLTAYVFVAVA